LQQLSSESIIPVDPTGLIIVSRRYDQSKWDCSILQLESLLATITLTGLWLTLIQ
jgi:hypothetical protein